MTLPAWAVKTAKAIGGMRPGKHGPCINLSDDQMKSLQLWWDSWVEPKVTALIDGTERDAEEAGLRYWGQDAYRFEAEQRARANEADQRRRSREAGKA